MKQQEPRFQNLVFSPNHSLLQNDKDSVEMYYPLIKGLINLAKLEEQVILVVFWKGSWQLTFWAMDLALSYFEEVLCLWGYVN